MTTAGLSAAQRRTRELWNSDDQFARQLGHQSHAAVIHRRWDVFAAAIERFCAARPATASLRVLDAGCGDGINLVGLRRILTALERPWHLAALDLNPVRIARARAVDRASNQIAAGSVTALPFASGHFDVVLCNHVIEHVPDAEAAIREIVRVLRPGGLAIVGVPNEGCSLARLRNHVLQRSILKTTDHVNFFTAKSLSALLSRAGLQVDDVHTGGFLLPHLRLQNVVTSTRSGRRLLRMLGRALPSQAADLIGIGRRKP